MYFRIKNKLINIKSYNNFKKIINNILTDDIYLTVNNRHFLNITEEKFNNFPLINEIKISYKIRGGFIGKIVKALTAIVNLIFLIIKFFLWIIQLITWIFRFASYLLVVLYNILTSGLFNTVKYLIYLLIFEPIKIIVDTLKKAFSFGVKKTENQKFEYKCYKPNEDGTIPTTILISTILCPPLGMFLMYGMSGWLKILISAVLSLVYYIPGLIYTLVDFYA